MERELPLYEHGVLRGQLRCREDGIRLHWTADCPLWTREIRKVWLCGGGGQILLGTLEPDGDRLKLRRTVTRIEISGIGYPDRGELLPSGQTLPQQQPIPQRQSTALRQPMPQLQRQPMGAVWQPLSELTLSEDAELCQLLRQAPGSWQRTPEGVRCRFPWRIGQPVPLMPLFCFLQPQNGWLVLTLNQSGQPIAGESSVGLS